jgi:hypothetical protein
MSIVVSVDLDRVRGNPSLCHTSHASHVTHDKQKST